MFLNLKKNSIVAILKVNKPTELVQSIKAADKFHHMNEISIPSKLLTSCCKKIMKHLCIFDWLILRLVYTSAGSNTTARLCRAAMEKNQKYLIFLNNLFFPKHGAR